MKYYQNGMIFGVVYKNNCQVDRKIRIYWWISVKEYLVKHL